MSEIDYAELDKEVTKAMQDKSFDKKIAPKTRGRYMDMVHPRSDMRPPSRDYTVGKNISAPNENEIKQEPDNTPEAPEDEVEFGIIEDVNPSNPTEDTLAAEEEFVSEPEAFFETQDDNAPDANNYSLGGKSPFIPDAKVEKRPLGDFVPDDNARGVRSTKNVYGQRTPTKQESTSQKPLVVAEKKKSGWIWALITLLVLAAGCGLGYLAYTLYTNQ